jgi:hypothetical protein
MSRRHVLALAAAAGTVAAAILAAPAGAVTGALGSGGCVVTGKRPIVIPGPRGIDAVHGTAIFACMGNVDTVSVSVTLIRGARVIQGNSYSGAPPFGIRRRVSAVAPCRRTLLPRKWRTLYSVFARNENASAYEAGQTKHVWIRCR